MKNTLRLFEPSPAIRSGASGYTHSSRMSTFGPIFATALIYLTVFNLAYFLFTNAPSAEGGGETTWDWSWMTYWMFSLPAWLIVIIGNIGWRTHIYRPLTAAGQFVMQNFVKLPVEHQAEFGGREGMIALLEKCSRDELTQIDIKIRGVLQSLADRREIMRAAETQAPEIMERLDSIYDESRVLNQEYRKVLHK